MVALEPASDPVVVLEDVWKRYPPPREPHRLSRILARLGGVELEGGGLVDDPDEDGDEDEEEEQEDSARSGDAALPALRGVSLSIEAGGCLGVVGPMGSGKSVLLRLIAGLAPPTGGRVVVRGTVAPALSSIARLVPSRLGTPKTLLALAMMTRLSRSDTKRRLPEIFELAGLPDAGVPGTTLTPPQMRRVLLAMMLSVDADIVLVDVPFEPGPSRERFAERIQERSRAGATIVIAAQTADEIADLADRFIHLEEGQIVDEDGEATEGTALARADGASTRASGRDVPLSPDAERYLDHIRLLIGDRRADKAHAIALAKAAPEATRIEWTQIAQSAGFGYVEHLGVVERLRALRGVTNEEPIFGPQSGQGDLPLSPDTRRYLDYLRILIGEERTEQALRNTNAAIPPAAVRVEWTWIARWAGFDYARHIHLIERLRAAEVDPDDEPIFGASEARSKASEQGRP